MNGHTVAESADLDRIAQAVLEERGLAEEIARRTGLNGTTVMRSVRKRDCKLSVLSAMSRALDEILDERDERHAIEADGCLIVPEKEPRAGFFKSFTDAVTNARLIWMDDRSRRIRVWVVAVDERGRALRKRLAHTCGDGEASRLGPGEQGVPRSRYCGVDTPPQAGSGASLRGAMDDMDGMDRGENTGAETAAVAGGKLAGADMSSASADREEVA